MSNRLEALRVFCTAADAANFRDAAIRLSVSPQVVTRAVRELEEELGEPLFHRSTRGVQLTDFGRQLAERARVGGRRRGRALPSHRPPRALAARGHGARHGAQRARPPADSAGAGADACGASRASRSTCACRSSCADVVDQQIDVGVRVGPLRDSRFVARAGRQDAAARGRRAFAASRAPACRRASTRSRAAAHGADRPQLRPPVALALQQGAADDAVPSPAFVTDDTDAECAAVLAGLGFGQLVAPLAEPGLQSGALVSVLDAEAPEPWPVYVYRAQRSPVPARVRLVYDELVRVLG